MAAPVPPGVAFKAELSKQAPAHQAEHAQLPVDSFVSRWSKQQMLGEMKLTGFLASRLHGIALLF